MKKLLAVFTMVMALFIINFATNAEAILLPLGASNCPPDPPSGPPTCGGSYTVAQMGSFDTSGIWQFNPAFLEVLALGQIDTHPAFGPDWLNLVTPTIISMPTKVTGRLDRRFYAPDNADRKEPDARIAVQVTKGDEVISYQWIQLQECFAQVSIPMDDAIAIQEISTPCHAPSAPITRVRIATQYKSGWEENGLTPADLQRTTEPRGPGGVYTSNDIESVKWREKNLFGTFLNNDIQVMKSASYNTTRRFWNPLSPVTSWDQPIDIQYNWSPLPTLTEGETATFEIKIKNVDQPVIAHTIIHSTAPMPIVLATYKSTEYNILKDNDKKSGKMVIKAEEIEVTRNNITVREIDDPAGGNALVIQWPEPDMALFGGLDMPQAPFSAPVPPNTRSAEYQVRVWVGAGKVVGDDYTEVFLFYDIPAQMGTCVVQGPDYEAILLKMGEKGFVASDLRVRLFYREVFWNMPYIDGQWMLSFQNRAMSALVPINE